MAWHWEDVLRTGQPSYWQTAPVDPYDAMKGRYVDLAFKETSGPVINSANFASGESAYAIIEENANGKSFISGVTANRPQGKFIKVTINYVQDGIAHINLPFKRYYLPEGMAPAAEIAYRQNAGKDGTALIRIKDGYGVVEELFISDKTIYEYLRTAQ